MSEKTLNCWEHKNCGREPGGEKVDEMGECPVCGEFRLNGANNGLNGGRSCWVMEGTLCGNRVQGSFSAKFQACKKCNFFVLVNDEEGKNALTINDLYSKLK